MRFVPTTFSIHCRAVPFPQCNTQLYPSHAGVECGLVLHYTFYRSPVLCKLSWYDKKYRVKSSKLKTNLPGPFSRLCCMLHSCSISSCSICTLATSASTKEQIQDDFIERGEEPKLKYTFSFLRTCTLFSISKSSPGNIYLSPGFYFTLLVILATSI